MKTFSKCKLQSLAISLLLTSNLVQAEQSRFNVNHTKYQQECSSCHIAFPPQLLSPASWRAVIDGLGKHFGTDASLDKPDKGEILRFLESNAGKSSSSRDGKPALRISETRWFVREHSEELPPGIWKHPSIKTPANCAACHTGAAGGDFSERNLRLPKGVYK